MRAFPTCKLFNDVTWTITTFSAKNDTDLSSFVAMAASGGGGSGSGNSEQLSRQELKCLCPANSVVYIKKHGLLKMSDGQLAYRYYFSCSPEMVRMFARAHTHTHTCS